MSHTIPIRIYYEDTDAGAIAYHASFIRFCERGRSEFLRHIGFTNSSLTKELGTFFRGPAFGSGLPEARASG
ncbi:MAG: hypothetical protein LRZ85_03115 [Alphaproteobacteria bacterium]|nr:hypothetical protein [Alphaproteobacteria bacterium]